MESSPGCLGGQWPGFDEERQAELLRFALSPSGQSFRRQLGDDFFITQGRGIVLGPPQFLRREWADGLRAFVQAYCRCLERVVEASRHDPRVQTVLALPEALARELSPDDTRLNDRIHVFRLDLMPTRDGGYMVIENNANCPGGLLYTGIAAAGWRRFLDDEGCCLPPPLPHESPTWMAEWFVRASERDGAGRPEVVLLLHEKGGNNVELSEYQDAFGALGIEAIQADPRDLRTNGSGATTFGGRPIRHAYLKLGVQPFLRIKGELEVLVKSIRTREIFVQNGMRGRWVADTKLCLAVLSDPAFADLFDEADRALVSPHIPWSRNLSLCSSEEVEEVRVNPARFVLKRGLDTRGRGVEVGREVEDPEAWGRAVDVALREEGWLVQEFCETTEVRADFEASLLHRHDLAVGVVDGEVSALFSRSSDEYKLNVAQNGRLHPVFESRDP